MASACSHHQPSLLPLRQGRAPRRARALLDGGQRRGRNKSSSIAGTWASALFDNSSSCGENGAGGGNGNGSGSGSSRSVPPGGQQPPASSRQQQQQHSIQHPIFPEPQTAQGGPLPVQTQRGLPLFQPVIGDPPCRVCGGTGKTTCGDCRGKGRLNYRGVAMLPQGAWPQWCPSCRASGRWCCASCMGTGVQRQPIGFRLPHDDD